MINLKEMVWLGDFDDFDTGGVWFDDKIRPSQTNWYR